MTRLSPAVRRLLRRALVAICTLGAALTVSPRPATACGGCFIPPPPSPDKGTVVTGHRMALSISSEQTILWDQIAYAGAPEEFAWVLPIKPGARIEVASDAWFDVLDAATRAQVYAPDLECDTGAFFCNVSIAAPAAAGCGDGGVGLEDGVGASDPPVTVVSHGSAGPYETVILSADEPGALPTWLEDHGYAIPADIYPLIDSYVAEGFDFVALRLLPAAGVQQMRPVRVVQAGAVTTLPLRMVAAGTGPFTDITLFVLSEGRMTAQGFAEVAVFPGQLSWDFGTNTSTYAVMREQALAQNGGRSFYVPFSAKGALFREIENEAAERPLRFATTNGWTFGTIAETYVEQAFLNGESSSTTCADGFDALADDKRRVVLRPCAEPAGCPVDDATEIDARSLMCDPPVGSDLPLDDLAQSLVGLHPADVWLTRLEAKLPREALDADLVLVPSGRQLQQSSTLQTPLGVNLPPTCDLAATPVRADKRGPRSGRFGVGLALAALFTLAFVRRAVHRRRAGAPGEVRS
jgi:hypothetical protein